IKRYIDYHYTEDETLIAWYECESPTQNIKAAEDKDLTWCPRMGILNYCQTDTQKKWPELIVKYFRSL
ncbi:hypothetical protein KY321_02925, partial [Candidatus Woesearchaeota archaeon]|nr:hypothetical protein [Candidatus Woesearchaeota archaeon]